MWRDVYKACNIGMRRGVSVACVICTWRSVYGLYYSHVESRLYGLCYRHMHRRLYGPYYRHVDSYQYGQCFK